jgi:predicted nucleic acid-binding protein
MPDQAGSLRKKHKKLALGDAIIAATGAVNGFTIITEYPDFSNIARLKVINPYDLQ